MRLWSLYPGYLDSKGLVAVWREGLLARKVLQGGTKGYKNHPQLRRFYDHPQPIQAIDFYLEQVLREAETRGYHFDGTKITTDLSPQKITVTDGQLAYEFEHLMRKLAVRDPERFLWEHEILFPQAHPLFIIIPGGIEPWEKIVSGQPNTTQRIESEP
jgi:hypothetical protein